MIVKMHKVSVLCLQSDRDTALSVLRDMGVLHLSHTRFPESSDLDSASERLRQTRRILDILASVAPEANQTTSLSAGEVLAEASKLLEQRGETAEQIQTLKKECDRLAPYGNFDPAELADLIAAGVYVQLYRLPAAKPLPELPDAVVKELNRDRSDRYFAVIARQALEIDALPLRLPTLSLADNRKLLAEAEAKQREITARLLSVALARKPLEEHLAVLEDEVAWNEARAGMGSQGVVLYLTGYSPLENAETLRKAAREHGWGVLLETPGEDDTVPTLVRHPKWVKPIQTVLDMIGVLPGYHEIDISAAFLLFLSLFFAILVGDAGYGLLFLGLAWQARRKFPAIPKHYLRLLQIMSVSTVIWGGLTGVYFGLKPEFLRFLTVPWLEDDTNLKLLCFIIGAAHLTLAHAWNLVRSRNTLQALAEAGWIGITWVMFFTVRFMVLDYPFPKIMLGVLGVGVLLVVLFMTPVRALKSQWFDHVMLPLTLVNNFVDVISYVRLFAVGAASFSVASSFNAMAAQLNLPQPFAGLAGAMILFIGHFINIALAAMGVMVHGVRLNTLEFSSHIGIQWSGTPFRPFAKSGLKKTDHK